MIAFLYGRLAEKHPTRIVVDVGGVGYEVFIPLSSYDSLPTGGEPCKILTYHHVREDTQILFGFMTEAEKSMFKLLMGTTGIGPKLALSALSGLSVRDLKAAIVTGDTKSLSSISGIGRKVAERLIVELKDKITDGEAFEAISGGDASGDSVSRDAVLALVALGYKQDQARRMVMDIVKAGGECSTVEEMVRKALAG
jgi:Holliday junction DNA helicase RuvA